MSHWSPEMWATFLAALGAFIGTIINALKGKSIEQKVDQHAAIQRAQHSETLAAIGSRGLNP